MRKLILSAAIAATATLAGPALAHGEYGRSDRESVYKISVKLDQMHERIDRAAASGILARGEAVRLQREHDQIARRFQQYRRNGLDGYEYNELRDGLTRIQLRLSYAQNDGRYDDRRYSDRRYSDRRYNDRRYDDRRYSRRGW